ncbi:hypothetical protein [Ktedonobacter racemifer]|uniref:Uncharacterized protein n=1 Tax=Ktedonobacter racemifer DSM 44963 TaxID=485913 RepID=D6TXM8_KTERA|nr:hypothetical protein [Ktedonobacter racemifer]EFH83075.1 hypothetical protein Krac_3991 [Ktedonobacter racemifer DSM 44963]
MQIKDGVTWYTKKEVFAVVHARRLALDESQFEDWQKKGIVPLGRKVGRGRGKGVEVVWSAAQVGLVCKVCALRQQQGVRGVAAQCTIPVWAWLYLGEESGVELTQLRRAMHTWAQRQAQESKKEAKERAREMVELVGNDTSSEQWRYARRKIAEALYGGKPAGEQIGLALWEVYARTRQANGPAEIALTPELLDLYEEGRRLGREVLLQERKLSDQRWWWARHIQLKAVKEYGEQQQRYSQETAGSVVAEVFAVDMVGTLLSSACEDVAMALGMEELLLKQKDQVVRERFGVDWWMERVRSVRLEVKQEVSPLVLLDGSHPGGLRLKEVVST